MIWIILLIINVIWVAVILFLIKSMDNCDKLKIPECDYTKDFQNSRRLPDLGRMQDGTDLQ